MKTTASLLAAPADTSSAAIPSRWLLAAELPRVALAWGLFPFHLPSLARACRGDRRPVMVIPGFGASDASTTVLRRYLAWLDYDVHGWALGENVGAKTVGMKNEVLIARLDTLFEQVGQKITLIGWSMGGIMARMIARRRPEAVERLILLASPFAGDPYANRAWPLYERMSGHSLAHPVARAQIAESQLAPPVPSVSIYSKSDGVVAWECCIEPAAPHSRNIEVSSAHCGFAFDATVLRTVADVLSEPAYALAA